MHRSPQHDADIARHQRVTSDPEFIQCLIHGVHTPTMQTDCFAAWLRATDNDRILAAMVLLSAKVPHTRRSFRTLVTKQVRIVVAPLDDAWAQYARDAERITITPDVVAAPLSVLAAVLAHEFSHVTRRFTFQETGDEFADIQEAYAQLLEDEMAAHAIEAHAWQRLRTGREAHTLADRLDETVAAAAEGRLLPYILGKAGYQRTYFGRPLTVKDVAA